MCRSKIHTFHLNINTVIVITLLNITFHMIRNLSITRGIRFLNELVHFVYTPFTSIVSFYHPLFSFCYVISSYNNPNFPFSSKPLPLYFCWNKIMSHFHYQPTLLVRRQTPITTIGGPYLLHRFPRRQHHDLRTDRLL